MASPSATSSVEAACPVCETPGRLGSPCPAKNCARDGVRAIPIERARAAWAEPSSKREPLVGHLVGEFLIIGRLGKGGFGKVLLGLQRPLYKLQAAVKLLELHGQDERVARKVSEKFDTEASVLAVLQHPNIVRLLSFGSFEDQRYLAMEFIPGARTLQNEITRLTVDHRALEPDAIKRVLDQVLNALEAAHDQGIIHRDIKPENIMLQRVVGDPWHVKILDFGLAKVLDEGSDTSLVLGTVQYMAPEQIEGKNLGPWTDLYAVGCIAFELITGLRAFPGRDSQQILRQKLMSEHDPLEQLGDHALPDAAIAFIREALARHAERRFQTAHAMRQAWGRLFDLPTASVAFSRDLSRLADSEEISRLHSEEQRLADERKHLTEERQKIERDRKQLESDRIKLSSERMGTPAVVEHAAHGDTQALPRAARTEALPHGIAEPGAQTASLDRRRLDWAPPPLATGQATVEAPARKMWWPALIGLLALGAGVAVPLALSGTDEPARPIVAAVPKPAAPELAAPKPAAPKPEPAAPTPIPAAPEPEPEPIPVAPTPTPATLVITTKPAGATVRIDGQDVGTTPYTHTSTVGARHEVELRLAGRRPEARDVALTEAATTLEVPLKAQTTQAKPPRDDTKIKFIE